MYTTVFVIVLLHLIAGFGYLFYKLEWAKLNKKEDPENH